MGGKLTEAVRTSPHSVVLFDEIEKAHDDVLNILLQILEDGVLTDGKGRTVSFKNTILIMTSNVGSQDILNLSRLEEASTRNEPPLGNDMNVGDNCKQKLQGDVFYAKLSQTVKAALEETMRPEFLNRIDEIVLFSPLSSKDLIDIADLLLKKITKRAELERDLKLRPTSALSMKVMEEGSSNAAQFGARPMRRAAQRFFEDSVSEALVRGFLQKGEEAVVDLVSNKDESPSHYVVQIRRLSDDDVLTVLVDKVGQGIGSSGISAIQNIDEDKTSFETEVNGNGGFKKMKKSRPFSEETDVEVNPVN